MMKRKKWLLGSIIFLFLLFSLVLIYFLKPPSLILHGKDLVYLEQGNTYKEPGYVAKYHFKDVSKKVVVKNLVNNKKLGNYKIIYQITMDGKFFETYRYVRVVDHKKPEITLTGELKTFVCPGKEYKEEGYQAMDLVDGDLTKRVKRTATKDRVEYVVSDQSKNEAKVVRELIYEDKQAPEIKLNYEDLTITQGNQYQDPGYEALDNCDGDVTDKVTVNGAVDTSKLGEYEITYTVMDTHENTTTVTRKVKVVEPARVLKDAIIPAGKTIYLTFDDGPSAITEGVLDVLKEENVKATFFVINRSDDYNYLLKRMVQEGHTIGLHSYTHDYKKIYASEDAFFNDLKQIQDRVRNITGVESYIIRFPGGSSNTVSRFNKGIMSRLTKQVSEKGYRYFDWNVGSGDAGTHLPPDTLTKNITRQLGNGSTYVVLMHDSAPQKTTMQSLKKTIQYGKEHGYRFDRIVDTTQQIKHPVNN